MNGEAFRRSVELFVDRTLSPKARSALLARTAREKLAALQASGTASRVVRRFVDGREDAAEESVSPDGVILYRFIALPQAAAFALAFLQGRSPVRSGSFRAGFYLGIGGDESGAGGRFVRAAAFNPAAVGGDIRSIVIGNLEPYARLVDVQLAGARRLRFSVPADIYSDAASAVRVRFPGLRADRIYDIDFPGKYRLRQGRRAGKAVQSPALIVAQLR